MKKRKKASKKKKIKRPKSLWPNPTQELLLKACLGHEKDAVCAWEQWISQIDFNNIDTTSYRLIPLLYRKMKSFGVAHPLMEKMKGIYRHNWYLNQMFLNQFKILSREFEAKGISTVILKGLALAHVYYKDLGLRHMMDFDVLIPPKKVPAVRAFLLEQGWWSEFKESETQILKNRHSERFSCTKAPGQKIDVHWHVLRTGLRDRDDRKFWRGTTPVDLKGVQTRILDPADQIVHLCAHTFLGGAAIPVVWLADVYYVLMAEYKTIDWDRLISQAEEKKVLLPVKETFLYLHENFKAPVPFKTMEKIAKSRVSLNDYLNCVPYYPHQPTAALTFQWDWYEFSRRKKKKSFIWRLMHFPFNLRRIWKLRSIWRIPAHILKKIWTRSAGMMRNVHGPAYWLRQWAHSPQEHNALLCIEKYNNGQEIRRIPHGLAKLSKIYSKRKRKIPPKTKFFIFGQGRSGTTLLQSLLNRHPDIQCDGEIFYDPVFFPYQYVYRRLAVSKKSCYGFKVKIYQLKEIQRLRNVKNFVANLNQEGWKIIFLKRENYLRQAISNQYATKKRQFHFVKGEERRLKKGKFKIKAARALKEVYGREYYSIEEEKIFQDIECCRVVYENDLLRQSLHQETLNRVFQFLGVESVAVTTDLIRMVPDQLDKIIENFSELERIVRGTNFEKLLYDERYSASVMNQARDSVPRTGVATS